MTSGSQESPLDRVLRALSHPVRRQVLRALLDGPGSASSLSRRIGGSLGIVSYHLNHVLANECDIVELTDRIQRRGTIEKFYRLKLHALSGGDLAEADAVPGSPRRMSLEECFIVAVAAMDAGAFKALDGSSCDWVMTAVDPKAWRKICAARDEFDRRVTAAVTGGGVGSKSRVRNHVVVGAAAFPAVSPSPPGR